MTQKKYIGGGGQRGRSGFLTMNPLGPAGGDLIGNYPNPQVKQTSTAFAFNGIINPADLAADTNDYNPAGLATANAIVQDATADINITGLAGGTAGRFIIFHNEGSAVITLKHNSGLSTAGNRFDFTGNMDFVLIRDQSILLWYDAIQSKWHNIGAGLNQFPYSTYLADQLILPIASTFPVNGTNIPTLARDSLNQSIMVLQFDDTTNEGIAFEIIVPPEALNINIDLIHRAETPDATNQKTVVPALYFRTIPNNLVMNAWSAKKVLTNNITVPAVNAYYQYTTIKERLLSMGVLRTGLLTQFEFIRDAASGTDNLVGDWNIHYLKVWFS